MADLDPALIEKAARSACDSLGEPTCSYPKCSCGAKNPASLAARAALLSLGIPAAALNALAKGEAVVVPKEISETQIDAMLCTANTHFNSPLRGRARVLAKYRQRHNAMLAASPYRSEP